MKPNLGVKIPSVENNVGGKDGGYSQPTGAADPIINTLNAPQQAPQTSVPQWGTSNVNTVADPNKGYQPTQPDMNSVINPNTDIDVGVPTYNTPSTNQQGAPGFSLNLPYQTTPEPSRILNSLVSSSLERYV